MTALLEKALSTARALPAAMQDDLARMVLAFAESETAPVQLTPEEDAALALSEGQAARGEFASDTEVRAIWAKHGL